MVEAAAPGNHEIVLGHGRHDALGRSRAYRAQAGGNRVGHFRHGAGQRRKRHAVNGNAAAVDAAPRTGKIGPAHFHECLIEAPLHRMVGAGVAVEILAHVQRRREKARARTIVMEPRRRRVLLDQPVGRGLVRRHLGAAFQVAFAPADVAQPGLDRHDMRRRGGMGRGGQSDTLVGQAPVVGRPRFDQGQGLQRLDRRSGIDFQIPVAPGVDDVAGRVGDHRMNAVAAFDQGAARDLDDRGGR